MRRRVRLRGESIEKRFGRVAALRGVDFDIAPGESVAILGANGAGKSSLLRILAGLSKPSAGHFGGESVESAEGSSAEGTLSAGGTLTAGGAGPASGTLAAGGAGPTGAALSRQALRGSVGYVGHATLLYGELTARENLRFAARLHGQRPGRDALDALLESFSLLEFADRRAGTFSRGMAQRLSIARAVVHAPGALLLDEPFTGLDEVSAESLSERLAEQREHGRTLVVVTHDPRRAVELSERALILHRGQIRATPSRLPAGQPPSEDPTVPFEVEALRQVLARLAAEARTGVAA